MYTKRTKKKRKQIKPFVGHSVNAVCSKQKPNKKKSGKIRNDSKQTRTKCFDLFLLLAKLRRFFP